MRIGIDLDNVTYPFVEQLHPIAEHILGKRLLAPIKWDFFSEWGISGSEFNDLLHHAWMCHGLWEVGTPMLGALDILQWLKDDGHEIAIITHRPDYAQDETLGWLEHWSVPHAEVHFAHDKSTYGVDVMLDDAPHVYEQLGDRGVVFHRPWNAESIGGAMVGARRVHSWQGFYQYVRLLEAAHVI